MSNAAQKLIDAVKHSLLGGLLVQLWPVLLIVCLLDNARNSRAGVDLVAGVYGILFIGAILAWLIGFAAIHRRPSGRFALERVQNAPPNGFAVWSERPPGGHRPPEVMKSIVLNLGYTSPQFFLWERLAKVLLGSVIVSLYVMICFSDYMPAPITSRFSDPVVRNELILCMGLFSVIMVVRRWAIDCCDLLLTEKATG